MHILTKLTKWIGGMAFLMIIGVTGAQAQATRTWVSGVGDDANPCSRTAPCKTFAGAISKTAAGGEIDALDPGGYGAVTITKAITIDGGTGNIAGVLVSGTNGIVVQAGASDVVILRNLDINGLNTGLSGIRFISGGKLFVDNSPIYEFTQFGIDFNPNQTTPSQLSVDRTMIRQTGGGIFVRPTGGGAASATISDTHIRGSQFGVRVTDNSNVTVKNSVVSDSTVNGFIVATSSEPAELNLENCISSNNGGTGIVAQGPGAIATISNTSAMNNLYYGVLASGGGSVISFGNNRIAGNATDGAPTSTIGQQ